MKTKLLLLLIVVTAFSFSASAQATRTHVYARTGYARNHNGNITKGEARFLRHKRHHIQREVKLAKMNDGKIGPMERKHIRKDMKQYRRARFVAVHNRRTRF